MSMRFFIVLALGVLLSGSGVRAQPRRETPKAEWAIKVERQDGRNFDFAVYHKEANIGGAALGLLPVVPGWEAPPDKPPLVGVRIMAFVENGAVTVKVWTVYSDFAVSGQRPKYDEKEEFLTEFLLPEGRKRVVKELERVGLQPITLKLAPPKTLPERLIPTLFPHIGSKIAGLEVASVTQTPATEDTPGAKNATWYEAKVANFSGKTVVYLETEREFPLCYCGSYGSLEGTLRIAPGETYRMKLGVGHPTQGSLTAADMARATSLRYYIDLAIFADGSYLGDEKRAARVIASWRGTQIQNARIAPLLAKLLAEYDANPETALAAFWQESEKIRIDPEPEEVKKLAARFPHVPPADIEQALLISLSSGKALRVLIKMWPELMQNDPQNYTPAGFTRWLQSELERMRNHH